jgi:hypothetical protein
MVMYGGAPVINNAGKSPDDFNSVSMTENPTKQNIYVVLSSISDRNINVQKKKLI